MKYWRPALAFLSGCMVTALLISTMAASPASREEAEPESGRFAISMNDNHVFVLDTATGKIWRTFVPSGSGQTSNNFEGPKLSE
jgi:hypothetical protein